MQSIKSTITYPFKLLSKLLKLLAAPFIYIWALLQWRAELPLYRIDPVTDEVKINLDPKMTPMEKAEYCFDKGIITAPSWIKTRREKVLWVYRSRSFSFWSQ